MTNLEICVWKAVVNNDIAKKAAGNKCVTFTEDRKIECYECSGTKQDAEARECRKYAPDVNE